MADYLAENNYLFQGNFSSSYLYFSIFANKDNDFGNALKTSTDEQLNSTELADIDDMVERVKEETEEAKEAQAKEALEKEAVEETL